MALALAHTGGLTYFYRLLQLFIRTNKSLPKSGKMEPVEFKRPDLPLKQIKYVFLELICDKVYIHSNGDLARHFNVHLTS